MNYIGQKCALCGEVFDESSDVVVCPECGAPHHRECYSSAGHCACIEKHASGYVWSAEKKEQPVSGTDSETGDGIVCSVCGNINPYGSGFCSRCGTKLGVGTNNETQQKPLYGKQGDSRQDNNPSGSRPLYGTGYRTEAEFPVNQYSFDGIKGEQWKKYIGKSVPFYFSAFSIMDQTGRKASFSWAAGLFPYAYFAYRRVWWAAVIAALLNIVLAVPSTLLTLAEMGISGVTVTESLLVFLSYTGTACNIINFAFKILSAIFGFWIYRKNACRKISAALNENRSFATGPSVWGVVIVVVALLVVNGIISVNLIDIPAYMNLLGLSTV